ncbi:MAG TPA: PCMD domain-containing protein [Paludibacteraceae bacterium]|nr:PCMD domain-containing protein [Paludibacteraceae bacterium]
MKKIILAFLLLNVSLGFAQERIVPLKFGDMESWTVRYIKESNLIGGQIKTLYVLGPTDTIGCENGNVPYKFTKTSWGISNAYANVSGVAKGANTTQPERRGDGWCARLDTRMETVCVLGMIDVKVAIAGTLFLGSVIEPVKSANDPYGSVDFGLPFTQKPKALLLDLKTRVSDKNIVTKALGVKVTTIIGHDEPEIFLYLQKRWEDNRGNIYAKRIATVRQRFPKTIPDWHDDYRLDLHYGDISKRADFKTYQGLADNRGQLQTKNSKGKMVPIQEVAWGTTDDLPTHIILMISAGCYPAFYGTLGNALWVDNLRLVY